MDDKISKTNDTVDYFNARLDQVQLSDYDRLRAKAHLARAEAFAATVAAIYRGIARLFQASDKPTNGRAAPSAG